MKTVFISYSWDNEPHREWVRNFANELAGKGLNVLFDQYDLSAGKNLMLFMEKSLEAANKVLWIFRSY